jgi:hypothetical protein
VDHEQGLSRPTGSQTSPVGIASPTGAAPPVGVDSDTALLHKMGYAQALRRGMGSFSNFAVSFSIV